MVFIRLQKTFPEPFQFRPLTYLKTLKDFTKVGKSTCFATKTAHLAIYLLFAFPAKIADILLGLKEYSYPRRVWQYCLSHPRDKLIFALFCSSVAAAVYYTYFSATHSSATKVVPPTNVTFTIEPLALPAPFEKKRLALPMPPRTPSYLLAPPVNTPSQLYLPFSHDSIYYLSCPKTSLEKTNIWHWGFFAVCSIKVIFSVKKFWERKSVQKEFTRIEQQIATLRHQIEAVDIDCDQKEAALQTLQACKNAKRNLTAKNISAEQMQTLRERFTALQTAQQDLQQFRLEQEQGMQEEFIQIEEQIATLGHQIEAVNIECDQKERALQALQACRNATGDLTADNISIEQTQQMQTLRESFTALQTAQQALQQFRLEQKQAMQQEFTQIEETITDLEGKFDLIVNGAQKDAVFHALQEYKQAKDGLTVDDISIEQMQTLQASFNDLKAALQNLRIEHIRESSSHLKEILKLLSCDRSKKTGPNMLLDDLPNKLEQMQEYRIIATNYDAILNGITEALESNRDQPEQFFSNKVLHAHAYFQNQRFEYKDNFHFQRFYNILDLVVQRHSSSLDL